MKELAQEMNETGVIAMIAAIKLLRTATRVRTIIEELKNYPSMKLLPNGVYYTMRFQKERQAWLLVLRKKIHKSEDGHLSADGRSL